MNTLLATRQAIMSLAVHHSEGMDGSIGTPTYLREGIWKQQPPIVLMCRLHLRLTVSQSSPSRASFEGLPGKTVMVQTTSGRVTEFVSGVSPS